MLSSSKFGIVKKRGEAIKLKFEELRGVRGVRGEEKENK
jgi:hypothetical protein